MDQHRTTTDIQLYKIETSKLIQSHVHTWCLRNDSTKGLYSLESNLILTIKILTQ